MKDLQSWLEKIKSASSGKEIFQILDEFRPGDWNDEDRALMSKTYIVALSKFEAGSLVEEPKRGSTKAMVEAPVEAEVKETKEQVVVASSEPDEAVDEEVWYEKL